MNNKEQTEEMMNDKFKNSPIHDKQAIISMMDELEPKDMIEVVELLKSKQQKPNKQQTAIQKFWDKIALKLSVEQVEEFIPLLKESKEMEMEKIGLAYHEGLIDGMNHTPKNYYEQTYGDNK